MEAFQKFSDPPLKKCNKCAGAVQKLISHSTFHLKGTGWYVTDYANKSGGSACASGPEDKKPSNTNDKKEKKAACSKKKKADSTA
jgi:putative FmdB family regulatory protein